MDYNGIITQTLGSWSFLYVFSPHAISGISIIDSNVDTNMWNENIFKKLKFKIKIKKGVL